MKQSRSLLFAERASCYLLIWQHFAKWLGCQNYSNLNTLSKLLCTQEQDAGVRLLKRNNTRWRLTSVWQARVPGAHQTFTAPVRCWWRAYSSGCIIAWVTSGDMQLGLLCFSGMNSFSQYLKGIHLCRVEIFWHMQVTYKTVIFLVRLVFGDKSVISCTSPCAILWSGFLDFSAFCWLCFSSALSWCRWLRLWGWGSTGTLGTSLWM